MLQYRRVWLASGWLLVVLVVCLSLMPHPPEPLSFKNADKLEHAFSYAMLALWFCQLYRSVKLRAAVVIALVGLGVALEFVQGWTGYRMFDVLDMLA
ncbi:MAG: VanZ family protein, partial [Gallionella sp.]|nr:VanZ family protein [Gallionella sp.]